MSGPDLAEARTGVRAAAGEDHSGGVTASEHVGTMSRQMCGALIFTERQRLNTSPLRPVPRSSRDVGSGTGDGPAAVPSISVVPFGKLSVATPFCGPRL